MKLTRETLRILLVDDDDMDCELVTAALKKAGFAHPLTHFKNGEMALEYFKYMKATGSKVPHVVLIDINMPLIDGVKALKRLREESSFRDLPVIMLTANDDPANRRDVAQLGIFRFIKKHPDCSKVVSALDDFLGFYNHEVASEAASGGEV